VWKIFWREAHPLEGCFPPLERKTPLTPCGSNLPQLCKKKTASWKRRGPSAQKNFCENKGEFLHQRAPPSEVFLTRTASQTLRGGGKNNFLRARFFYLSQRRGEEKNPPSPREERNEHKNNVCSPHNAPPGGCGRRTFKDNTPSKAEL